MPTVCKDKTDIEIQEAADPVSKEEAVVICRICSSIVTRPFHRIMVNNSFSHAFANPQGDVFEIGCFIRAQGCVPVSDFSSEFTWFPSYSWKIGACTGCAAHLGWVFSLDNPGSKSLNHFYGLILDKLIFP